MTPQKAVELCLAHMRADPTKFYGPAAELPLGAGLILRNCPVPANNDNAKKFDTGLGAALVITHECDVDEANERAFNNHVLVIPVVPLSIWVECMEAEQGIGSSGGLLPRIAANDVFRVMYLPPTPSFVASPELAHGGIINLNTMTSSPIAWHDSYNTHSVCSLSALGLRALDYKLQNYLFRPKSAALWFRR